MSNIKLFESKKIRSVWNEGKKIWYFSVQDVVEALTDSGDVKQYIKKMLSRDVMLKNNWGTICTPVEMLAADGKKRKIQASDTKGLFRIIQSIPSPKAEPFKLWLAQVGSERLDEIENPELATQLDVDNGIIKTCSIFGDFFCNGDISIIQNSVIGCKYETNAIREALENVKASEMLYLIKIEELVSCFVG